MICILNVASCHCSTCSPFHSGYILYTDKQSEDLDKMPHQDMHFLIRLKQSIRYKNHNLEMSAYDPFKNKMDYSILIVSICLGISI